MALFHHSARIAPTLSLRDGGEPRHQAQFELPAQRSSVGVARRLLAEWLNRWQCPEPVVDTAQLVISEFVTNAVIHTVSDRIVCRVQECGRRLRVEVRDEGTGCPGLAPRCADVDATNGRGLQLVDALADSWGDSPALLERGRVVWAELRFGD